MYCTVKKTGTLTCSRELNAKHCVRRFYDFIIKMYCCKNAPGHVKCTLNCVQKGKFTLKMSVDDTRTV